METKKREELLNNWIAKKQKDTYVRISDGWKNCDFKYWYNGNGTEDFSLGNHEEFLNEVLEKMPDRFSLDKNVAWVVFDGGGHAYNCWIADLYNSLLVFFKK